jgi:hypothetical protein
VWPAGLDKQVTPEGHKLYHYKDFLSINQ